MFCPKHTGHSRQSTPRTEGNSQLLRSAVKTVLAYLLNLQGPATLLLSDIFQQQGGHKLILGTVRPHLLALFKDQIIGFFECYPGLKIVDKY